MGTERMNFKSYLDKLKCDHHIVTCLLGLEDIRELALANKLLYVEAIDNFSDKVGNFVCVSDNLGAHRNLNLITLSQ